MEIRCRKISEGKADGEVIVSKDSVCFYLVEPETGVVVEKNHDIEGKSIAGKILVMPSGKGSSVVQADGLFKLAKNDKAPKAMIIEHADTVLVRAYGMDSVVAIAAFKMRAITHWSFGMNCISTSRRNVKAVSCGPSDNTNAITRAVSSKPRTISIASS